MTIAPAARPRRIDDKYGSRVVFGSESILAPFRDIRNETDELTRRLCLHEAGHAVLSVVFGRIPHEISIVADDNSAGRMIADQPPAIRDRLCICYAGAAGESLEFTDFNAGYWASDMQDADRLLERAGFNARRRFKPWTIAVNRFALEDARRLTKRFAEAIQQVANLLDVRKEISGNDVARVVADCGLSCALVGV